VPAGGAGAAAYEEEPGSTRPLFEGTAAPHPWHRWFARMVDLFCFGVLFGMMIEILAPGAFARANDIFVNVLLLAAWVPVEALLLATFGTTPGKALLRITLGNADGSRLSFGLALDRSFQVWIGGLGLGLPLVALITEVAGYNRLMTHGATTWDNRLGLRVSHAHVSAARWTAIALIVIASVLFAAWSIASTST
jgi:uncharacterized RDD family membrane protein YckC